MPPVGTNSCTDEIVAPQLEGGGHGDHLLLVTPACDIGKISAAGGFYQLVAIIPFEKGTVSRSTLDVIAKKTHTRYHLLPPSATYRGGIVDFWQLHSIPSASLAGYARIGQVTDPFGKDIVSRLGAWISRQGSPEFQEAVADQAWAKMRPPAPVAAV